jgi:hypothetical protein
LDKFAAPPTQQQVYIDAFSGSSTHAGQQVLSIECDLGIFGLSKYLEFGIWKKNIK